MNQYKVPDLPYDYGALEPHVSGKIMELHHDKHHAGYVNGANAALERLDEARTKEQFDRIPALCYGPISENIHGFDGKVTASSLIQVGGALTVC